MSFVISSRKYRLQQFKTVKGQQHVITTLKNAVKNEQLAQAFLFCGPKGAGKTTCARVLSKAINCTVPKYKLEESLVTAVAVVKIFKNRLRSISTNLRTWENAFFLRLFPLFIFRKVFSYKNPYICV